MLAVEDAKAPFYLLSRHKALGGSWIPGLKGDQGLPDTVEEVKALAQVYSDTTTIVPAMHHVTSKSESSELATCEPRNETHCGRPQDRPGVMPRKELVEILSLSWHGIFDLSKKKLQNAPLTRETINQENLHSPQPTKPTKNIVCCMLNKTYQNTTAYGHLASAKKTSLTWQQAILKKKF
jgi:hypothetical protein